MLSLYLMLVDEDKKNKCILNPFRDQTEMAVMHLFEHMLRTVRIYSSMCYDWSELVLIKGYNPSYVLWISVWQII